MDIDSIDASPQVAFEKYVDALLDLLIKGHSPGIKEEIVDLHKKEEIVSSDTVTSFWLIVCFQLFLGPDEGTAGYVDWAARESCSALQ